MFAAQGQAWTSRASSAAEKAKADAEAAAATVKAQRWMDMMYSIKSPTQGGMELALFQMIHNNKEGKNNQMIKDNCMNKRWPDKRIQIAGTLYFAPGDVLGAKENPNRLILGRLYVDRDRPSGCFLFLSLDKKQWIQNVPCFAVYNSVRDSTAVLPCVCEDLPARMDGDFRGPKSPPPYRDSAVKSRMTGLISSCDHIKKADVDAHVKANAEKIAVAESASNWAACDFVNYHLTSAQRAMIDKLPFGTAEEKTVWFQVTDALVFASLSSLPRRKQSASTSTWGNLFCFNRHLSKSQKETLDKLPFKTEAEKMALRNKIDAMMLQIMSSNYAKNKIMFKV